MMASNRAAAPIDLFESHPSLSASLEDFENNENPSPVFRVPSQHSGFRSDDSEGDVVSNPDVPWSPHGFKRSDNGSGWYRHQPYPQVSPSPNLRFSASGSRSPEASPHYESADEDQEDYTIPANIPLPRGSMSPVKEESPVPEPLQEAEQHTGRRIKEESVAPEDPSNYIRFSLRADVQHRTESFESALLSIRRLIDRVGRTRISFSLIIATIFSIVFMVSLSRLMFQPLPEGPMPDLVKVAGLARSFEPLLLYSEHGMQQITNIQLTSTALWDLGETVRQANLTSAAVMSKDLDGLSYSFNQLAEELTRFFANVNGDIDAILIVMDWAKRELAVLPSGPPQSLSIVFNNVHNLLSRSHALEDSNGNPTPVGTFVTVLFGRTAAQQTRYTLQRTFNEFISILEESIEAELTYSNKLFSLFNTIENYFDNLQRTTARATDDEAARSESEVFSSLWSRLLGPNAARMRKYERNKDLLHNVRAKTVMNKNLLVEHNHRLMALKQNLERIRQLLLSPLVQGGQGSSTSVEDQIIGLDGTYQHLSKVREDQKQRVFDGLFGPKPWDPYQPILAKLTGEDYLKRQTAIDGAGL